MDLDACSESRSSAGSPGTFHWAEPGLSDSCPLGAKRLRSVEGVTLGGSYFAVHSIPPQTSSDATTLEQGRTGPVRPVGPSRGYPTGKLTFQVHFPLKKGMFASLSHWQ
jgi:hypothetical protein